MKALQAQDNGSAAKDLYWRMVRLDEMLDPLVGSSESPPVIPVQVIGISKGKAGPGRGNKTGSDSTRFKRGETEAYLLGRLARDAPDTLERVKSGEIKSARAAAIEAGIITPFPSLQLKDPAPTAQKRAI